MRAFRVVTGWMIGGLALAGACGSSPGGGDAAPPAVDAAPSAPWTAAAPMIRARWGHAAILLIDGRVMVVGGFAQGSGSLDSVELYDPARDMWALTTPMMYARALPSVVDVGWGRVMVVGGEVDRGEIWDGAFWTVTAPAAHARYYQSAVALADERVLVAGGGSAEAEIYERTADVWTPAGSMASTRESFKMFATPTGAIAIGGRDTSTTPSTTLATTEIYDAATNSWQPGPPMNEARYDFSAVQLADGSIVVAGGYGLSPGTQAHTERLDAGHTAWTTLPDVLSPREEAPAAALSDGTVVIAGGNGGDAERWRDGDATWSYAGTPAQPVRVLGTLTRLQDGRLLLAGGAQDDGGVSGVTATAELGPP